MASACRLRVTLMGRDDHVFVPADMVFLQAGRPCLMNVYPTLTCLIGQHHHYGYTMSHYWQAMLCGYCTLLQLTGLIDYSVAFGFHPLKSSWLLYVPPALTY
jgi:hypothetical protein